MAAAVTARERSQGRPDVRNAWGESRSCGAARWQGLDLIVSRCSERWHGSIFRLWLVLSAASRGCPALKVLLAHTPQMRRDYYGERSLNSLRAVADVRLHEGDIALDAAALVDAARDVDIIIADRMTHGPRAIFPRLPNLRAFVRCAVDIRNVDVAAASACGVLVTQASPGFVQSVAELAVGYMVDLSRGVSRATAEYHAGRAAEVVMGRQLAGSRIGIIGYGSIGRYLAPLARALGMEVLVADPFVAIADPGIEHVPLEDLLARSDYVVCLAIANEATENLIGAEALARMQRHAVFINLSRGNLVDEAALADALRHNRIAGAALDVGR